jgi:hypothetical protein
LQELLKLAQGFFLGLGLHFWRGGMDPCQDIVFNALVIQRGYGLEPCMLLRCHLDGKTHNILLIFPSYLKKQQM